MVQRKSRHAAGSRRRGSKALPLIGLSAAVGLVMAGAVLWAQSATDPGVRGGPAGAGAFIQGLTAQEQASFTPTKNQFLQPFVVTGAQSSNNGLGPRFDSNSCVSCHSQPAPGGSSPASNPLFNVYQLSGALNNMPSFETNNGPVLVPRFPFQSDLVTPDGLVHELFVITGRTDAGSCNIAQPDFNTAAQNNNLVFRQPLPTFGDGYIEFVQDVDILNNMNSNLSQKQALGIAGTPNIAGDGTFGRLGWKAQWRAVLPASGSEENVELGDTSEIFPNEIDETSGCVLNAVPEDVTNYAFYNTTNTPWRFPGNAQRDAIFIRFLAAPTPGACPGGQVSSCANGQTQFNNIGCVLCHTTSYTTPHGSIPEMGLITINLYSDLLLHHMGPCLADNIVQGVAEGDMWRTPPLWNVGQRIFFMHDGRTNNVVTAIEDHFCSGNSQYPASEANAVVSAFNALSPQNQQDLVNFLRSL